MIEELKNLIISELQMMLKRNPTNDEISNAESDQLLMQKIYFKKQKELEDRIKKLEINNF